MVVLIENRMNWNDIYAPSRSFDEGNLRISIFPLGDTFEGVVSDPQSLHKYLYCHADPINYNDPSGKFEGLIGLLSSMSIQSIGRGIVNTYSLGASVWAKRMIFSAALSIGIQFYATVFLPPLWKELHGLADDVGVLAPDVANKIDLAGDYVEDRYWSITKSNITRLAIAATLAPWPKFRLGVGITSLFIAGSQFQDMLEAVNAHIVTLNEVAKDRKIPIELELNANIGGIFEFLGRGLTLQLDPAGQVHLFRQAFSSFKRGDNNGMRKQLVQLEHSLLKDYGHLVRVKLGFVKR
jgi:hypothetical protein